MDAGSAYWSQQNGLTPLTWSHGYSGALPGAAAGGLFASTGIPSGLGDSGEQGASGGGTGGGGGGGYQPAGGGTGGAAGGVGGGGGGGGAGAGASYVEPGASNVIVGNGQAGDGSVTITWPLAQSATSLSPLDATSQAGTPITHDVSVTALQSTQSLPAGTVALDVEGKQVTSASLSGGTPDVAVLTTTPPPGIHTVQAVYQGRRPAGADPVCCHDPDVDRGDVDQRVRQCRPAFVVKSVTFTAIVPASPSGGPSAAGTVSFCGTPIARQTVTLNNGRNPAQATYTTTAKNVAPGSYPITLTTKPSASFYSGSSATVTLHLGPRWSSRRRRCRRPASAPRTRPHWRRRAA